MVHVLHHHVEETRRESVEVFLLCRNWIGEIENKEPHKCEKLAFFEKGRLPEPMAPYITQAIKKQ